MAGVVAQIQQPPAVGIMVVIFLAIIVMFAVMYFLMGKKKGSGLKTPLAKEQAKKK